MNPRISIIIPIYNAADLINRCIKSILSQTFQYYEIVIVDDGSTDDSLSVCKEIAKKDDRISIFHQQNGGQVAARGRGFKESLGDFVYFVDADDFLPKDALNSLYSRAMKHNLDIVDGASISYFEDFTIKEKVIFPQEGVFGKLDYLRLMFKNHANNGTHACLVKRTLFTSEVFDIPRNVRLGEDAFIHLCFTQQASRIGIFNDIVYYYVQNRNSITNNYVYTSIRPVEYQIESIRKILEKYGQFEMFKHPFYNRAIGHLITACIRNPKLVSDPYVYRIASESYPVINSFSGKVYCLVMKYPFLLPFLRKVNKLRKLLKKTY